jgi:hypothetical protein
VCDGAHDYGVITHHKPSMSTPRLTPLISHSGDSNLPYMQAKHKTKWDVFVAQFKWKCTTQDTLVGPMHMSYTTQDTLVGTTYVGPPCMWVPPYMNFTNVS